MAKKRLKIKDKQGNVVDFDISSASVTIDAEGKSLDVKLSELVDAIASAVKSVTFNGKTNPIDANGNVDLGQQLNPNWNESNPSHPSFIENKPDVVNDLQLEQSTKVLKKTRNGVVQEVMTVPSRTSQLQNDSGYITIDDVPKQGATIVPDTSMSDTSENMVQNKVIKAYVDNLINGLINGAPAALDTLNELSAALGNNADFASVVMQQISAKYTKPQGGIPASDLEQSTQTAIDNAASAIRVVRVNNVTQEVNSDGVVNIVRVDGQDAPIPHIGENGHWWVGDENDPDNDTGIEAQGPAGDINLSEGVTPTLTIVKNLKTEDDEQNNIKVLSAGMGKKIGEELFGVEIDVANAELINAFILNGAWAQNGSSKYKGKIFDVSQYKGWRFRIGNYLREYGNNTPSSWWYRFALLKSTYAITTPATNVSFSSEPEFNQQITISKKADENPDARWYEGIIPNDVNYIYVYCYNSDNPTSTAPCDAYFPPELIFICNDAKSRISRLENQTERVPVIEKDWFLQGGVQSNYSLPPDDCWKKQTIGNDGRVWTGTSSPTVCAFPKSDDIAVPVATAKDCYRVGELPNRTITLTFEALTSGYFWKFSVVVFDKDLKFLKRYTPFVRVESANNWTNSIYIDHPMAVYFKLLIEKDRPNGVGGEEAVEATYNFSEGFCTMLKQSIKQESMPNRVETIEQNEHSMMRKFTLCSWNIGHFSLGKSYDTFINGASEDIPYGEDTYTYRPAGNPNPNTDGTKPFSNYAAQLARWRSVLNQYSPDVLMMCEYIDTFAHNVDGKDVGSSVVFGKYAYKSIGPLPSVTSYMRTCVYSNIPIGGSEVVYYDTTIQAGRYYQCVDTIICGKPTKLVVIHLDFGSATANQNARTSQINDLIAAFANESHVVICGDFNISSVDEYDAFAAAGFTMANHGYLGDIFTYPSTGTDVWASNGSIIFNDQPRSCLDNILVKGFAISNIRTIDREDLSDHMGLLCDLTLID